MTQNNHYIWYLPLYFFLFFSCYTILKFIFIFFFMTAYTPPFLFDFTFLYAFSGFDNTQLLFIGMVIILCNLYFHMMLSKKHLFYSFPLTLLLLSGMGLRVATSPISLNYIFHYFIFSLLLFCLVIDHRLYLFIPEDYKTPLDKTKMQVEKVNLPAFNMVHPTLTTSKQGFSSVLNTISKSLVDLKQTMSSRLGFGSPQPTSASLLGEETSSEEEPFVHPVEKDTDKIATTKQLLNNIEACSFDRLDSRINETTLGEESFLDKFFSELSEQIGKPINLDEYDFSSIVNQIDESAVIIFRGVVKAANHQFSSLVKQPIGDIIDHDFIHFLAPEGFASFKSHCSKRLSGEKSQTYDIVLQSKHHEKIPLQASIKSTTLNGEIVEITVFQKMNT
jgi:hypothetical protein